MKVVVVSDVHIKEKNDKSHKAFSDLLTVINIGNYTHLILLGDIFDLLVGSYEEYYEKFKDIFLQLESLLKKDVKIVYVEGNHDFHAKEFFKRIFSQSAFFYSPFAFQMMVGDKKFVFSHGDEIETENFSYQLFRFFLRNHFIDNFINFMVPFSFLNKLGKGLSNNSRKQNLKYHFSQDQIEGIKNKFRRSALKFYNSYKFDFLVMGHSHVLDDYNEEGKFRLLNNGFFPETGKFTEINEGNVKLMSFISQE